MACCRLVFPLLVLSVVQLYAVKVPVFLWGDLPKAPLKYTPLTVSSFDEILTEELKDEPFTVIFIEETLSVEDFSFKNAEGETSFPYLHANIGNSVYLPSVNNSLNALNNFADPEKTDHINLLENGLSAEIEPESGNFLFINLKDAQEGETRSELLRRHNDFMEDMFTKLQEKNEKVVAIYTANYPSWTIPETHLRFRRQAETEVAGNDQVLDGLRLYYSSIKVAGGTDPVLNLTQISGHSSTFNTTTMNTTLDFDQAQLVLNFRQDRGYWFFDTVQLSLKNPDVVEQLFPTTEVYAIMGFCYRCGQDIVFSSVNETKTYTVTFEDSKIQPYFATINATTEFGDSFNCVGFFSVPIWSGLFVVFILLSITFYGIMMMMDIRTMDRFDDPKGKTITINAAE